MSAQTSSTASPALRWAVIAAIAGVVLFASYRFAVAQSASSDTTSSPIVTRTVAASPAGTVGTPGGTVAQGSGGCCGGASGSASGSTSGGCCGGGAAAPASSRVTKSATVAAGVQKITVDTSKGYYDPSSIQLKAGVPAEITFTRAGGCLGQVVSEALGFSEDLSSGPKTIQLPALQPGTYAFHCGMNMVTGSIVVK